MFGIEIGGAFLKMVEERRGRKSADRLLLVIIFGIYGVVALIAFGVVAAGVALIEKIAPLFGGLGFPSFASFSGLAIALLSLVIVIGGWVILRLLKRTTVAQSALDRLSLMRAEAINKLYANPPKSNTELTDWENKYSTWEDEVKEHLRTHYPPADESRFSNLGVILTVQFSPGLIFNARHERRMRFLVKQLDTLEEFLASYRGR